MTHLSEKRFFYLIVGVLVLGPQFAIAFLPDPNGGAETTPSPSKLQIASAMQFARPNNEGSRDVVNVALDILSITELNEDEQKIGVNLHLKAFWEDSRLVNLVEKQTVFTEKIPEVWIPKLTVSNAAESLMSSGRSFSLKPDGTVDFSERILAKVNCPISMMRYPFGKQKCVIHIKSDGYTTLHVILLWNGMIMPESIPSYDADYSVSHLEQLESEELVNGGRYSTLSVEISLHRSPLRLIFGVILPTFILSALSYLITFFMGKESLRKLRNNRKVSNIEDEDDIKKPEGSKRNEDLEAVNVSTSENSFNSDLDLSMDSARLCVNALFLLIATLVGQITFHKTPRSRGLTALDVWVAVMTLTILTSFITSLQIFCKNWRKRKLGIEVSGKEGKALKFIRIFIPVFFIVFLISFLGFCLS